MIAIVFSSLCLAAHVPAGGADIAGRAPLMRLPRPARQRTGRAQRWQDLAREMPERGRNAGCLLCLVVLAEGDHARIACQQGSHGAAADGQVEAAASSGRGRQCLRRSRTCAAQAQRRNTMAIIVAGPGLGAWQVLLLDPCRLCSALRFVKGAHRSFQPDLRRAPCASVAVDLRASATARISRLCKPARA